MSAESRASETVRSIIKDYALDWKAWTLWGGTAAVLITVLIGLALAKEAQAYCFIWSSTGGYHCVVGF